MGCAFQALSGLRAWAGLAVVVVIAGTADARVWKDATGLYTINADLVGFDDDMVILQRENKELGSCPIDKLCKEDRDYLKSKEALEIHNSNIDQTQTWTMTNGLKLVGKIVDYERDSVVIKKQDGNVMVNDKPFDSLPVLYQDILLRVIETVESKAMPDKGRRTRAHVVTRAAGYATKEAPTNEARQQRYVCRAYFQDCRVWPRQGGRGCWAMRWLCLVL